MYRLRRYKESDRMSDLICENFAMLLVLSRFGLSLGFGERSIGEVCRCNGVDAPTFLTVVNMLVNDERPDITKASLSLESLVVYLRNSHAYFLDFRLPAIRRALMESIDYGHSDVSLAILRYYDEYVDEVRKHMTYEEEVVFPYVSMLLTGKRSRYEIATFSRQHNQVEAKLIELKDIIIKYYPAHGSNELNCVLFDIFMCAHDLGSHNDIEDNLFVPVIRSLELKLPSK